MTKEEFIKNRSTSARKIGAFSVAIAILFIGWLAFIACAGQWLAAHPAKELETVYLAVGIGWLLGILILMAWVAQRGVRRAGLLCPSCSKPLTDFIGCIAVTTGNCGHCGKAVFTD